MTLRPAAGLTATLAFLAGLPACAPRPPESPQAGPVPFEHRFAIRVGGETVQTRIAVHPQEQQRGLMFTKSLPEDEGMLFVYESPQRMSFWMRNVPIALDIGFFDGDGVLREIHPMYPNVEDYVISRSENMAFALEMNRDWYARHGVRAGARLDLKGVREALDARGLESFRLPGE